MKALFYLLAGLTVTAFVATVSLAYVGALTDDIHVWQCWFVTLILTLILALAAFGAA